jgi:ABC-type Mn2+/Zn2+ transport system permease subunit
VAIACAVIGTFVVLRGLAFIGDALAHGVLPGIAGAILLGLPGMLGAAVGAVVMIGGVTLVTNRSRLSSDTAIGLLFVAMLALGVVMVSASDAFGGDLLAILFGQILGTSATQLVVMAVATAVVVAVAVAAARPFLLLSFDPEQADVAGFPSRRYHTLMMLLVALTVVVAFQTVGTLLVFGMLLAPAATGALLAHRISLMMLIGVVVGSLSTYLGLLASYWYDVAASATIVLVAVGIFFAVLIATNLRAPRPAAGATDPATGETLS